MRRRYFIHIKHTPPLLFILAFAFTAGAAPKQKGKSAPLLKWRAQLIHKDNNEGIAGGDIDVDGKADVTSGEFWYQAPDFKQQRLRKILPCGADYMQDNFEHLYDV